MIFLYYFNAGNKTYFDANALQNSNIFFQKKLNIQIQKLGKVIIYYLVI